MDHRSGLCRHVNFLCRRVSGVENRPSRSLVLFSFLFIAGVGKKRCIYTNECLYVRFDSVGIVFNGPLQAVCRHETCIKALIYSQELMC
jgi:hypothetical protein